MKQRVTSTTCALQEIAEPENSPAHESCANSNRAHTLIVGKRLTGERALFQLRHASITNCVFEDGESPLKEGADLEISDSIFRWKYPLWYCDSATVRNTLLLEMARAGMWYSNDLAFFDCTIEAPKGFRRCRNLTIKNTSLMNAEETLWSCDAVTLESVHARGDYFAMNSSHIHVSDFELVGNYSFDGCKHVEVSHARLLSKDAFWNCENVIVRDSFITGEYLGWNSKNLTFENCTIESLQGLCYIDGLVLRNCKLVNATRAFEYCTGIDADITTVVDSVVNPQEGTIRTAGFGEVIQDDPAIDPKKVHLVIQAAQPSTPAK